MVARNTIAAVVGGMALGAGIAVTATTYGQETRTVLVQQPSGPAPVAQPVSPAPQAGAKEDLHVTALAADTFVTVKDHGDAQTVSVFKIDARGVNHLSHKAKFFY